MTKCKLAYLNIDDMRKTVRLFKLGMNYSFDYFSYWIIHNSSRNFKQLINRILF